MIRYFAETAESSTGLFDALGINVVLLIEQTIAFLILVAVLGKFVYPVLVKAIDGRRETIEAGLKEAAQSHQALEKAEAKADDVLVQARKDAEDLLARSHTQAAQVVADAEGKAKLRAEQIVADAKTQLEAEVRKARAALKKEAVVLVAAATEHVIGERVDAKKDSALIERALAKEPV
jgi:F-type H+-transporting ATPase subunit b